MFAENRPGPFYFAYTFVIIHQNGLTRSVKDRIRVT